MFSRCFARAALFFIFAFARDHGKGPRVWKNTAYMPSFLFDTKQPPVSRQDDFSVSALHTFTFSFTKPFQVHLLKWCHRKLYLLGGTAPGMFGKTLLLSGYACRWSLETSGVAAAPVEIIMRSECFLSNGFVQSFSNKSTIDVISDSSVWIRRFHKV